MELFERIREISIYVSGTQAKLASLLGIPQNTFNGYLKLERQDNLWPLLPLILRLYPQISREWLYFGEGEMVQKEVSRERAAELEARIFSLEANKVELEKELKESKDEALRIYRLYTTNVIPDTNMVQEPVAPYGEETSIPHFATDRVPMQHYQTKK